MKQILVQLDLDTAARLEKAAPARSRGRSEFVRMAIRKALWEHEEQATREAYLREPDSVDAPYLDAAVWEPGQARSRARRRR
jgi:predicted transcriptional regulator